jgi:hypothetical protein
VALPVERSDLATMGMPSPHENRRAVFVASVHQNSMWWNRLTLNRSERGLDRTKLEKPASLYPPGVSDVSFSLPIVYLLSIFLVCCLFNGKETGF